MNYNDYIKIEGLLTQTGKDEADLTSRFNLQNSSSPVTFYDPLTGKKGTVYVDNSQLKFDSVERVEGSKTNIKINVENPGSAPLKQKFTGE